MFVFCYPHLKSQRSYCLHFISVYLIVSFLGEDIALQMSIAKANASYSELSLSPLPLELKQETLVDVVIASDINTLGGMIALINSIISNTKTTVIFHLITNEETAEYLE